MKRNVTKEIKSIARERVGRIKGSKVIVPKTKKLKPVKVIKDYLCCYWCELPTEACCCSWGPTYN